MDKELKFYVIEIIVMVLFLIITVPLCVDASNKYILAKENMLNSANITIDVKHNGEMKSVRLYSNNDKVVNVKLGLMINNFYDEYLITVDDNIYNLNDLEYLSDDNYRYYILGTYEVDNFVNVDFNLEVKDKNYFDEDYFITLMALMYLSGDWDNFMYDSNNYYLYFNNFITTNITFFA